MQNQIEKLWTVADVARYCQVKPSAVKYLLKSTGIPFLRIGRQYRFDPNDIMNWLDSLKEAIGLSS